MKVQMGSTTLDVPPVLARIIKLLRSLQPQPGNTLMSRSGPPVVVQFLKFLMVAYNVFMAVVMAITVMLMFGILVAIPAGIRFLSSLAQSDHTALPQPGVPMVQFGDAGPVSVVTTWEPRDHNCKAEFERALSDCHATLKKDIGNLNRMFPFRDTVCIPMSQRSQLYSQFLVEHFDWQSTSKLESLRSDRPSAKIRHHRRDQKQSVPTKTLVMNLAQGFNQRYHELMRKGNQVTDDERTVILLHLLQDLLDIKKNVYLLVRKLNSTTSEVVVKCPPAMELDFQCVNIIEKILNSELFPLPTACSLDIVLILMIVKTLSLGMNVSTNPLLEAPDFAKYRQGGWTFPELFPIRHRQDCRHVYIPITYPQSRSQRR